MNLLKRILLKIDYLLVSHFDDYHFTAHRFKKILGYKPDLDNPKTFNEKVNWAKLYDRKSRYTLLADKYKSKAYVESLGLKVVPIIGVYDNWDEINFDALPNEFVIKTNHDSGTMVVCKNKSEFNFNKAKRLITKRLNTDYYKRNREWPYKDIERKIIIEKYIDSLGKLDSVEYKLTCLNGKVGFVTVCRGIPHHKDTSLRKNDFYDVDFNLLPFGTNKYFSAKIEYSKPTFWEKMIEQAKKVAEGTIHLRVDFYVIDNEPVFGEATFFSRGGFVRFVPTEYDKILGEEIKIPM